MVGFAGVTAIEVTVNMVNVVDPEIPAKDALIVLWPAATALETPPALIVAIGVFDEFQTTQSVRS